MNKTAKRIAAAALAAGLCVSIGITVCARGRDTEPAESGTRQLPIIMYHSVVNDASLSGEYVITAGELEADLRFLRDSGYEAVLCDELCAFVDGEGSLPEKPVVLSFDDGCYNNFYYALPLIESYGFKAVFAPVGEWTQQAAAEESPSTVYSYMDAENLRTCAMSGRIEIADHTWSLHDLDNRRGVLRRAGESEGDYRRMLWCDLDRSRRLIERITGAPPLTLVYPYGFCSDESEQLAAELGYRVTFGCEEKLNAVSVGDYGCLCRLGRYNRASGRTVESIINCE